MLLQENETIPKDLRLVSHLDWADIRLGARLGEGSFNCVFQAGRHNCEERYSAHSERFVLKCPRKCLDGTDAGAQAARDLETEAEILRTLPEHSNIIHLYAVSKNLAATKSNELPFILLERLEETLDVHLYRLRLRADFEESNIISLLPPVLKSMARINRKKLHREQKTRLKSICLPIADALAFLHHHRIVYRDLKPTNIGFSSHTGKIKLFDFGLSRFLPRRSRRLTPLVGSLRYMAPEVFLSTPSGEDADYGLSCDIFSYGLLMGEVCTLQRPTGAEHNRRSAVSRGVCDRKVRQLSNSCMTVNPAERPSMVKILRLLRICCKCDEV